jgi:hypothetical protein
MSQTEGFGTLLQYGDASTGSASASWTNIARIVDIEPPMAEASDIKTTHHQSASHTHEYQAGIIEPGECKVTIQFSPTNEASLRGLLRTPKGFRVLFSDGGGIATNSSRLTFDGYLKSIGEKTPLDDIVTEELTFKCSGPSQFVAAS